MTGPTQTPAPPGQGGSTPNGQAGPAAPAPDPKGFLSIDQAVEAQLRTLAESNPPEPDTTPVQQQPPQQEPSQQVDPNAAPAAPEPVGPHAQVIEPDLATQPPVHVVEVDPFTGMPQEPAQPPEPQQTPPEPEANQYLFEHNGQGVTLDEAQHGYLRMQDYTQKTQQVADDRRQIQNELAALQQERQHYHQALTTLKTSLSQQQPGHMTPEQLEVLRQDDPMAWMQQKELQREHAEKLARIEQEQDRVAQEAQAAHNQQFQTYLAEQQKQLAVAVPQWGDEKYASEQKVAMRDYLKGYGFSDDEMGQVYDHRLILILQDAIRGKLAADPAAIEKKRVSQTAPTMKASARQPAPQVDTRVRQAADKFAQSGSLEDAVDFQIAQAAARDGSIPS